MFVNVEYVIWKVLDFFQRYFLILDVFVMYIDDLVYLVFMIFFFERFYDLKYNIYNLIKYCFNQKNNIFLYV